MDGFKPNDILCILRFIQILTHRKTQFKEDVLSINVKREIFIQTLLSISPTVFVINTFQRLFTEENICKETQLSCNLEHAYKLLIFGTHVLSYTFLKYFLVIRAINQTENNHISLYSQKNIILQFIQTSFLLYLSLLTNIRDDLWRLSRVSFSFFVLVKATWLTMTYWVEYVMLVRHWLTQWHLRQDNLQSCSV